MREKTKKTTLNWCSLNSALQTGHVFAVVVLSIFTILLVGCQPNAANEPLRWTEIVTLPEPDFRRLYLVREQKFNQLAQPTSYWFEFTHPDTQQLIRWEDSGGFFPISLYLDTANAILLVQPARGPDSERAGCPVPFVLAYRFSTATWKPVSLMSTPRLVAQFNIIYDAPKREFFPSTRSDKLPIFEESTVKSQSLQTHQVDLRGVKEQTFSCKDKQIINFNKN